MGLNKTYTGPVLQDSRPDIAQPTLYDSYAGLLILRFAQRLRQRRRRLCAVRLSCRTSRILNLFYLLEVPKINAPLMAVATVLTCGEATVSSTNVFTISCMFPII